MNSMIQFRKINSVDFSLKNEGVIKRCGEAFIFELDKDFETLSKNIHVRIFTESDIFLQIFFTLLTHYYEHCKTHLIKIHQTSYFIESNIYKKATAELLGKIKQYEKKGVYKKISKSEFKPFWDKINTVFDETGCEIDVYYNMVDNTHNIQFNGDLSKKEVLIIVNRNLITLALSKKTEHQIFFRTLLYHELGHLIQNDAIHNYREFHAKSEVKPEMKKNIFYGLVITAIIILKLIIAHVKSNHWDSLSIGILIFIIIVIFGNLLFYEKRRDYINTVTNTTIYNLSEDLADIFSIIKTMKFDILKILENEIYLQNNSTLKHRVKTDRITELKDTLTRIYILCKYELS